MQQSVLIIVPQSLIKMCEGWRQGYEIANFHTPLLFSHHLILVAALSLCRLSVCFFLSLF